MREDSKINHALPRTLIETMLRRMIRDIQNTPKRGIRNLVDMALNFADGRFETHFFKKAQAMLRNEHSSYYKLIPDVTAAVDTDKIVMFGLNLGYNSCNVGVRRIRDVERQRHFNVPWSITLTISGEMYAERESEYRSVLEQGMALGVYTWMIHALDDADGILSLAADYPQCAFVLHCDPAQITDAVLDHAQPIPNLMFAVRHTQGVEDACRLLRLRRFLYAVFYTYGDAEQKKVLNGELLCGIEALHPVFTAFLAKPDCSESTQKAVYQYISQTRNDQKCPTILWDAVGDSSLINRVISQDSCLSLFDPEGYLCTFQGCLQRWEYNIFRQPLSDILSRAFPKANVLPAMP